MKGRTRKEGRRGKGEEEREELMANETILRRLSEMDQTLLLHDEGLRDLYQKLMPLLEPGLEVEGRKIGFAAGDEKSKGGF